MYETTEKTTTAGSKYIAANMYIYIYMLDEKFNRSAL